MSAYEIFLWIVISLAFGGCAYAVIRFAIPAIFLGSATLIEKSAAKTSPKARRLTILIMPIVLIVSAVLHLLYFKEGASSATYLVAGIIAGCCLGFYMGVEAVYKKATGRNLGAEQDEVLEKVLSD